MGSVEVHRHPRTAAGEGSTYDWIHVYSGVPVPPTGFGSFNHLLWEVLQEHRPNQLLISKYYPESFGLAQRADVPVLQIAFEERLRIRDQVRQGLTGVPGFGARAFVQEAARQIARTACDKILAWGGNMPFVAQMRRALPDREIALFQRYFEVPGATTELYGCLDLLIVQTEGTVRSLFERHRALHPTVVTIPNGVDLDTYQPISSTHRVELRARLDLPADKVIIIFPSKLHANRGTSYLRHWIEMCRSGLPEVLFLVTQSGPSRPVGEAKALLELLRSSPNVRWLGGVARDEMPQWFQASDAALMPGVMREGMSMAAVEALASGLPVIAGSRGVYPEFVFHGYNGLLCRPEDLLREGYEALRTIAYDAALRVAMSANARGYAEKRLDRARCLANLAALFEGRLMDIDGSLSLEGM